MVVKKWCIWQTPYLNTPNGTKILDIPLGSVVEATGNEQDVNISGHDTLWAEVTYRDQTAWVYKGYLDDLVEKFPNLEVPIPNPSPEPNDAAQYLIWDGRVKYNACGELCAAFIGGDDIETFLNKWKEVSPGYYIWAIGGKNDNLTGTDALDSMLSVYGHPIPNLRFDAGLTDPIIGFKISPGRIKKMLEKYYLIAGVKIDLNSGKLRGQGIGHWVVLDKIVPNGINGGWVELYNPFPNKRQEYSYDEFIKSCGGPSWSGVWIKRNLNSKDDASTIDQPPPHAPS